jgi:patatin-like phospholipase
VKVIADAHRANLPGLALSGGGIRSATFNLGVLQALADLNLLSRIDYLSTVSGGGYIGGWLAAWTKRLGSFAEVQKRLAAKRVHQAEDREPEQIRFLRVFSNYLTPKVGPFSADTWGSSDHSAQHSSEPGSAATVAGCPAATVARGNGLGHHVTGSDRQDRNMGVRRIWAAIVCCDRKYHDQHGLSRR